jgi:hypothetical protein
MHFCAQHCLTFTLENGQFTNHTLLPGQRNVKRVFAVERFTSESVIIHRTDYGDFPLTSEYTGRMSDDGNSLSGNGWMITWGPRLNDLPADDQERDRRSGWQQPQSAQITLRDVLQAGSYIRDWIEVYKFFNGDR